MSPNLICVLNLLSICSYHNVNIQLFIFEIDVFFWISSGFFLLFKIYNKAIELKSVYGKYGDIIKAKIEKNMGSFVGWHWEHSAGSYGGLNLPPLMSTLTVLSWLVSMGTKMVTYKGKKPVAFHLPFSHSRTKKSVMISMVLTSEYFINSWQERK